jgi:hypothetical protein
VTAGIAERAVTQRGPRNSITVELDRQLDGLLDISEREA